jgi:hypothetical protein
MQRTSLGLVAIAVFTGAAGCGSDPATTSSPDAGTTTTPVAASLPLTVSDVFAPSGYMGDGATPGGIQVDTTTCLMPRPTGAVGDCYKVTYTPGTQGWAGVYWQYPANNWGASPGKRIAAGATKVAFYAAGAAGGEALQFVVGGENDGTLPYHDAFKVMQNQTLTTALAPYSVALGDKTYDTGVLGGFAWLATAPVGSTAPIVFYLDAITWQK